MADSAEADGSADADADGAGLLHTVLPRGPGQGGTRVDGDPGAAARA
ncbi:hypothetical protein AB0F13_00035 [Streptomyces sp. NPDC026206]